MYYQNHFDLMFYPYPQVTTTDQGLTIDNRRVVVISDSDYKKYQQKQAVEQVTVLENQLNTARTRVQDLERAIVEVKQSAGLIEPAKVEETTE